MEERATSTVPATEAAPRREEAARPRRVATKKPRPPRGVAVSDPVGDMLTRLRNGIGARHESVTIPTSHLKAEVAKILKAEGYIAEARVDGRDLVVRLKYSGKVSVLTGIRRVSRPGRRVYARRDELPRVLGGLGTAIVSTSAGVMSGREARRRRLGGEVLATVW